MFSKDLIDFIVTSDNMVESAISEFKSRLSVLKPGIRSRKDADKWVKEHVDDILLDMSDAAAVYSDKIAEYSEYMGEMEAKCGQKYHKIWESQKKCGLSVLKESYDAAIRIADMDYPKSYAYSYRMDDVRHLVAKDKPSGTNKITLPEELADRLTDDYIMQYLPSDDMIGKCNRIPPKEKPETVLKGICIGDYIGEPYEAYLSYKEYSEDDPYDIHTNQFTDDSVMAFAIYEACSRIKVMEKSVLKEYGIIPDAYKLFVMSMRYYTNMLPEVGYGPRFYKWAIENGNNYESWANGGAMRVGTIGAYWNKIEDVIRYAIVSAFATHSHEVGERGAVWTAVCVWLANHGASKEEIAEYIISKADKLISNTDTANESPEQIFDLKLTPEDLGRWSENEYTTYTLSAVTSVSQALINFICSENMAGCISNAMKYRCDADTIAAISGGISAAYYGNVPYIDSILSRRNEVNVSSSAKFMMNRLATL